MCNNDGRDPDLKLGPLNLWLGSSPTEPSGAGIQASLNITFLYLKNDWVLVTLPQNHYAPGMSAPNLFRSLQLRFTSAPSRFQERLECWFIH